MNKKEVTILSPANSDEKQIAALVYKILHGGKLPQLTVEQVDFCAEEPTYQLFSASKDQALVLAALKIAAELNPLEHLYITCKVT